MQREPWTYSLIEMHEAAKKKIAEMVSHDDSYDFYAFKVERVCRCDFSDGDVHYLIWLESSVDEIGDDVIEVAMWLEEQMEEFGYNRRDFSVMLNGAEIG